MANIEIVIKIPEELYGMIQNLPNYISAIGTQAIREGIPLPKGHGRIVDIGKIDEDKINKDNPIIGLTINGEYIEAISLNYLNNLSTIIEADKAESEV